MKILIHTLFIFTFLFTISCIPATNNINRDVEGIWKQVGYGMFVTVDSNSYSIYYHNKANCHFYEKEDLEGFHKLTVDEEGLLSYKDGINTYLFERINELPGFCKVDKQSNNNDPVLNFEALWNSFNEHYAYFDVRDIDWELKYNEYRDKISSKTTEIELYNIMDEMLSSIGDGHVTLSAPEEILEKIDNKENDKNNEDRVSTVDLLNISDKIINKYVTEPKVYNAGLFRYGKIGNVGYIQSNLMMLLADYGIDHALSLREFYGQYGPKLEAAEDDLLDEIAGTKKLIESAISDMGDVEAYILDYRFNGGGKDEVGMTMLSYFADKTIFAGTKKAKLGNGFTVPQEIKQDPNPKAVIKPLYILTSQNSASATEVTLLHALNMSNVTIIGSRTEGIFSDMLDRTLPNGWEYSLSNEIYESVAGENYESIGIPPSIDLQYPTSSKAFYDLLEDQLETDDLAIKTALDIINTE